MGWIKRKIAELKFWWECPFIGDRRWGKGEQRRLNFRIAMDRWEAKGEAMGFLKRLDLKEDPKPKSQDPLPPLKLVG